MAVNITGWQKLYACILKVADLTDRFDRLVSGPINTAHGTDGTWI